MMASSDSARSIMAARVAAPWSASMSKLNLQSVSVTWVGPWKDVSEDVGSLSAGYDGEAHGSGGVARRGDGGHFTGQRTLAVQQLQNAQVLEGAEGLIPVGRKEFQDLRELKHLPVCLVGDVAGVGEGGTSRRILGRG